MDHSQQRAQEHHKVAIAVFIIVPVLYVGMLLHWHIVTNYFLGFAWGYVIPSINLRWHTIMLVGEILLAAGLGWLCGRWVHQVSRRPIRGALGLAAAAAITYAFMVASINGAIANFVTSLALLYASYRVVRGLFTTDLPWLLSGFIVLMVSGVLFASIFTESDYTRRQIGYQAIDNARQH